MISINTNDNMKSKPSDTINPAAKTGNQVLNSMRPKENSEINSERSDKGISPGEKTSRESESIGKAHSVSSSLPSHLTLINLKEEYNFLLLEDFYYTIMKPNFPLEEELDSLENFDRNLRSDSFLETEIAVLFDEMTQMVAGGVIYDYYSVSNVGLLSYFCIDQRDARYRGMGLGKYLVKYAFERSQAMARRFNKSREGRTFRKAMLKQLFNHDETTRKSLQQIFKDRYFLQDSSKNDMFAFLAETNKLGVQDGVLESDIRHRILNSYGFRFLDFEYVQPPLYETLAPCYDLILLAYKNSVFPTSDKSLEINREIILSYMTETAYAASEAKPFDYREEKYFRTVEESLRSGPLTYQLLELPWVIGRSQSSLKTSLKKVNSDHFTHLTLEKKN